MFSSAFGFVLNLFKRFKFHSLWFILFYTRKSNLSISAVCTKKNKTKFQNTNS